MSASRRPRRRSRPRARRASSSSSSSPPTGAAASTGSGRSRRPTTCARSSRCGVAGARVGLAPHSVRACPRDWLEEIGRYAEREGLVLHVHADEQPREIEECLAEHGLRPIELLAETGCLGPRTTVVHATHADESELDLLAEHGAGVCLCPTTEANLGDGFPPLAGLLERGIPLSIGSDSNVRIDPLEELRELEGTARRQELRRNVIPVERAAGDRLGRRGAGARARRVARASRSTSGTPRSPASSPATSRPRSCTAAGRTSARPSRRPALSSAPSPPGSRSGTRRARPPARARGWRRSSSRPAR